MKDHHTISNSNIKEVATKAAGAEEAKVVEATEEAIKINTKEGIKVETELATHNNINQRE